MDGFKDAETAEIGISSARAASFVALTQGAAILINGVTLILVARLLGIQLYAAYTLAYGVLTLFSASGGFGVSQYLNKHIPQALARRKKEKLPEILGDSIFTAVVLLLALFIVGTLLSGLISQYVFHSTEYVWLITVALMGMVTTGIVGVEYNALIGFRDGSGSAIEFTSSAACMSIASITLVYLGFGAVGAMYGIVIGSLAGIVAGLVLLRKHARISVKVSGIAGRIKDLLSFSTPLMLAGLFPGLLPGFAVLLLGVFASTEIVSSYGVAYRLGGIVLTVIGFVSAVSLQMFSSAAEGKNARNGIDKLYNYSIYFASLAIVPVTAYLFALPGAFVSSVFPTYVSARLYIPALTVAILLGIVWHYAVQAVTSMGDVKVVLKYSAIVSFLQLFLLIVLVPLFSAYGIIFGLYLFGSLANDLLYIRYMERKMHIKTKLGGSLKVGAAGVVLAALLYALNFLPASQTAQLAAGVVLVLAVYPILLGVMGAVGRSELQILRAVAKRIPTFGAVLSWFTVYVEYFVRRG
ncbi:MAG: oligosaccharide flippase family protein [Candidatus Micrarchaeota archaeon]|nr:oligosaccharide flippase family protein [Candidatus Micrarchaeota archaeon]